jgi:hypothetical protein
MLLVGSQPNHFANLFPGKNIRKMPVFPGPFDLYLFPGFAQYILKQNPKRTDDLVDRGYGKTSLLYAVLKIVFDLLSGKFIRRKVKVPGSNGQQRHIATDGSWTVIADFHLPDKPRS